MLIILLDKLEKLNMFILKKTHYKIVNSLIEESQLLRSDIDKLEDKMKKLTAKKKLAKK